ncbi:hypothetical protein EYC80_000779 [Monilinia laxa]|uniref:Uncharacterized protein n=1 Tax=Monilinia laxa TaxID=61186 RepID=A0A5N6K788_MONLA|nr:hypothetical protein EYC80_000779 [Monilinia laxa]
MSLGNCPASPDSCSDSGIDLLDSPMPNPSSSKIPIPQRPCRLKGQVQLRGCQREEESPLISPLPDTSSVNLEYPFQESRDIPSPPKRRRLRQLGPVNEGLEPFGTGWSRKLSFGDGGRIYDGGKQSHIKNGKEIEEGDPCAEYLKCCGGTDAKLKRKIAQSATGKLSVAFSDDYAGNTGSGDKHLDEMFDLAIRSITLDRKISMVQRRKKSAEMSLMSLESFDAGIKFESIEAALEKGLKPFENFENYVKSENSRKQLQNKKELKEKAEMSLKFLEKLSGEVEGLCHENIDEVGSSDVDKSSMSASCERNSEYKVDPEKEREVMALGKKEATFGDKLSEVSPTLTGETLYPRDTTATHFAASFSHGNDTKNKSKHVAFKDAEDERSNLPSSKLDHVSGDIPELKETAEEENPIQTTYEMSKSYRRIKRHLIVATGQALMKDFIELFQIKNESDEDGEACDDYIDEELIKDTAEIVRRAMIYLDTEAFNDALQQASEAALGLVSEDTKVGDILSILPLLFS